MFSDGPLMTRDEVTVQPPPIHLQTAEVVRQLDHTILPATGFLWQPQTLLEHNIEKESNYSLCTSPFSILSKRAQLL